MARFFDSVECPKCGAKAGEPCVFNDPMFDNTHVHVERAALALEANSDEEPRHA